MVSNVRDIKKKRDTKEYLADYYLNHKNEIKARKAEYYQNNEDKIKVKKAEYYQNNKAKIKAKTAEYYQNNKNEIKVKRAEYYQNNKIKRAEYYQNNKNEIKLKNAEYRKNNKYKTKVKNAEYYQNNKNEIKAKSTEHYQNNKTKINNISRTRYRNIKIKLVRLMGSKCEGENCNIEYDGTNASLFQFHHINPKDKLFELSSKNSHTQDEILNEVKKCKLLCANCHSLEHTVDKPKDTRTIKERNIKVALIKLMGNKCQNDNCNIEYNGTNGALFQFHHINPKDKLFGLSSSRLLTHTQDEILDEAKKCKLLCANCHTKIHFL